jgi:hypothetical protein
MPRIGNAPNGIKATLDGSEGLPLTGSFYTLVSTIAAYTLTTLTVPQHNHLINGGFDFAQRQDPTALTTYSANTYSADRWKAYAENASYQYQRQDGLAESGLTCQYFGAFKKITNAGKMFVYQIVEGRNSAALRGKTVIFQAQMKASSAKTIRMGIFELQSAGTIDTVPSPIVTAAGANSTDPTMGTNVAVITAAQSKSVTTSMQTFSVSVTVPSNSKNLICAIWTDSQFSANDILYVAEAGLYARSTAQAWAPRPVQQEIALCHRYYWKTFDLGTAPAQNAGVNIGEHLFPAITAGATAQRGPRLYFPVFMFAAPTVTTYNPSAANAQVRDQTGSVDCSATTTGNNTPNGVNISCTGNAATAAGNGLRVHVTAEAEL